MTATTRRTILYMDDTPSARALVTRLLSGEYNVIESNDPLDGLEKARQSPPDLALLDINMPNMTGREVAALLKTIAPDAVLVAFTADTSSEARERALAAGCDGFMTKPLDVDTFSDEIAAYLAGKRDSPTNPEAARKLFLSELVGHLETKVRALTQTAERNAQLNAQNQRLVISLQRRQRLLEAAARVSEAIISILDLDELLRVACLSLAREYGFYFAAIFLYQAHPAPGQLPIRLRAGSGADGVVRLPGGLSLPLDTSTTIGRAIVQHEAQLLQIEVAAPQPPAIGETLAMQQPAAAALAELAGEFAAGLTSGPLSASRARLAMPLVVKNQPLGALVVDSDQIDGFHAEDIAALQSLANQVAIAINNALLLQDLDQANRELLRNKTFEAIATATGETIHWVGNKAAPIPSSARRVREDTAQLAAAMLRLLDVPPAERLAHPLWPLVAAAQQAAAAQQLDLAAEADRLQSLPARQLARLGGLESILEDLTIIEQTATAILAVKEDFIGPARRANITDLDLAALIRQSVYQMNLPAGVVEFDLAKGLPPVRADARQLGQVYNNLVKNAWEALSKTQEPRITVSARLSEDARFIYTTVQDNGPGIPPELLEKIWMSFFTTKGERGGTGLGLSACTKIVNQAGGRIAVESQPGHGAAFSVTLPVSSGAPLPDEG